MYLCVYVGLTISQVSLAVLILRDVTMYLCVYVVDSSICSFIGSFIICWLFIHCYLR